MNEIILPITYLTKSFTSQLSNLPPLGVLSYNLISRIKEMEITQSTVFTEDSHSLELLLE